MPHDDTGSLSSHDSMGSHRYHREDRLVKGCHKPFKQRGKFSEKVTWNGTGPAFRAFKRGIEGHLMQVGAGYLIDPHFLYYYLLDPTKYQKPISYSETDEVWTNHNQSCHQIRYDKEFLYGILVTATRNIPNKTIVKHSIDRDGIKAWVELKADFDNDGSKRMKMEELDDLIHTAYLPSQEGGLSGYIDRFLTYLHELEMLQEKDFA